MQVSIEWMKKWFLRFNEDYFEGLLPLPRLRLSQSRTRIGAMSFKRKYYLGKYRFTDCTIHLSNYYDLTERQFQNVLLHEMIHYMIAYIGFKDTSAHGIIFRRMMDYLNRDQGWEVTVTWHREDLSFAHGLSKDRTYLVLAVSLVSGERMLSVVNPEYARRLNRLIPTIQGLRDFGWYQSNDPYFSEFPKVRSLRGRKVNDREYQERLSLMKRINLQEQTIWKK